MSKRGIPQPVNFDGMAAEIWAIAQTPPRHSIDDAISRIADFLRQHLAFAAFMNYGTAEADFIADGKNLNCTLCGGSGHVDDARVPNGWQLVPVDPTEGMLEAAINPASHFELDEIGRIWDDMLAAAPKPEKGRRT